MPNNINGTLTRGIRGPLPDYWGRAAQLPFKAVPLPEPRESPTRLLSPVERATVQITAPQLGDVPPGNSILHEAATRLSVYQWRRVLPYASGHYIATALQSVFWPSRPGKHARRGWVLLAAIDAADLGVEVWISGEPLHLWGDFRRMRLHERLDEISPSRTSPLGRDGAR